MTTHSSLISHSIKSTFK